jgi:hypothetical protein
MTTSQKSRRGVRCLMCGVILGLIAVAMPALAASSNVLPPTAEPQGYSLAEIAEATAVFNTSGPAGRSEATEPSVPFQILYISNANPSNTFHVPLGTMLYVPVVFADNSAPILGDFPDVNDPEAVSAARRRIHPDRGRRPGHLARARLCGRGGAAGVAERGKPLHRGGRLPDAAVTGDPYGDHPGTLHR